MKKIIAIFLTLFVYVSAYAQSHNFSAKITDTKRNPISGAMVTLLNTGYATTTDETGTFIFKDVPAGRYTLHVENTDYASVNRTILINGEQLNNIVLQKQSNRLEEVVVTAQKREEEVQQVPIAISTLTNQQVQDYRIWNLKDLTAVVPNLYSSSPGDNRNVTGIRGIVTTSYDPAVATYIDGVNQFSLDTYIPQLFDVERVEVLRGPQGTLYGRNAMAGVINILTRQPTNIVNGFAEASIGNFGQQRYTLGIRTPLIKDKLFFGAAGLYNGFNGFYTNQFNNSKLDKQHSFTGNYYLKFKASEDFALTLNVKNYANRNRGPFTLSGSKEDALTMPYVLNQNATTKMIDNILNASLSADYTGDDLNFSSNTSYQENYRYYTLPIDGDFSQLDAVSVINNYGPDFNKVKVVTQEFRISSPASASKFKWATGIYGFYRNSPTKVGTHFGADAAAVGSDISNFTSINTNKERNYGAAIFGQAVYNVDLQWAITAGLRYDYEHKRNQIRGEFQPDEQESLITQNDTASSAKFNAFTPKLSINYQASADKNIYLTYSRGFRAGGISQIGPDVQSQPPLFSYRPEFSNNYELGSKNEFFSNRLRINVSLFYTVVNNAQVPTLILPEAITITKNAGKLKSKGLEAEAAATLWKGLDLLYNFGYTHARYTRLAVANNGTALNLDGNRQIYTPEVTSMLAMQYGYAINRSGTTMLTVRGEWRYLGDHYFDLANQIEQKSYSTFNGRLGIVTKPFSLFLWGSNLTDRQYLDYAYDFGASHLGNPRTYGVTLSTKF